ncbi:MAG: hypothetical protein U0893_19085 [Chloroflexota bacterium]
MTGKPIRGLLLIGVMVGSLALGALAAPPGASAEQTRQQSDVLQDGARQIVTQPGPDGTPQFDRAIERRTYQQAAPDALLTYATVVYDEVRKIPQNVNPEQMKSSDLRKRLLDLRLMLDFNAFLYDPDRLEQLRGQVDAAYEAIGQFKDLSDQAKLTGQPIDPDEQSARGAAMIASLEWLRNTQQRQAFLQFVKQPKAELVDLRKKDQPRLWRNADVTPDADKSALAIVALVSGNGLANLVHDGLLVDDILDPDQEADFHDVRKALRSILVLVDMFPTAQDVVGDAREPLAKLVDAYGEVNDASIAYHEAQDAGRDTGELRDDLVKEYKQARRLAQDLVDGGQLKAYIARLTPLQLFDVDPFH